MNHRVLTPEQIQEAKLLRKLDSKIYTKSKLAQKYEVGETTIYENIYTDKRRDRREYLRLYFKRVHRPKKICIPCAKCEICLTRVIDDCQVPINYQVGDLCVGCYLRQFNREYMDLLTQ